MGTCRTSRCTPRIPQARLVNTVVDLLERGGTIALPTDPGYAIATKAGNKAGMDTIRSIRKLGRQAQLSPCAIRLRSSASSSSVTIVEFRNHEGASTPDPTRSS